MILKVNVETKSTQCNCLALNAFETDSSTCSTETMLNGSDSSTRAQNKAIIDELQLNLKIKENLIDNINDALVLKEAEIARLKTRIGLMERENIINVINENASDREVIVNNRPFEEICYFEKVLISIITIRGIRKIT